MPGRIVNFAPQDNFCRPARDDEEFVMREFAIHAAKCRQCRSPYQVHLAGERLCDRGHALALDVAQYIYSKAGKAFSLIDRERTEERVQIEIPKGCDVIRDLLKAVDRGMRLRRKQELKPVVSHDRTYHVPDRPIERRREPEPRYEVVEPTRRHRKEKVYISGRGSLYESDAAERRKRYEEEPVYIMAVPRTRTKEYHR